MRTVPAAAATTSAAVNDVAARAECAASAEFCRDASRRGHGASHQPLEVAELHARAMVPLTLREARARAGTGVRGGDGRSRSQSEIQISAKQKRGRVRRLHGSINPENKKTAEERKENATENEPRRGASFPRAREQAFPAGCARPTPARAPPPPPPPPPRARHGPSACVGVFVRALLSIVTV